MKNQITALITTSPLVRHPATHIIEQVYDSIRYHLPDIPIIVLVDGMHESQAAYALQYEQYKKALNELRWSNVKIKEFAEYTHQLDMARQAFNQGLVETPLILWAEHDWALLPRLIEWEKIVQTLVVDRDIDSIRFAECDEGPGPVVLDYGPYTSKSGVPLLLTGEYFSCPNLTHRDFYKGVFETAEFGRTFMDSVARGFAESWRGKKFRLSYYNPLPGRQRSIHLDGRDKENPKALPKPPETIDPNYHHRCHYSESGLKIS